MLYLDSSALVKRYILETGTENLNAKLRVEEKTGSPVFTSVLAYAEIHATIRRRCEARLLSEKEASQIQDQFDADWLLTLTAIELSVDVLGTIRDVLKKVHLKSADAIHLASALWLQDSMKLGKRFGQNPKNSLVFVCSDRQLNEAALHFGLEVFNPEKTR